MKKGTKTTRSKGSSASRKVEPLESPVIRLGVVFVILAALALMYYAGQQSALVMMMK